MLNILADTLAIATFQTTPHRHDDNRRSRGRAVDICRDRRQRRRWFSLAGLRG